MSAAEDFEQLASGSAMADAKPEGADVDAAIAPFPNPEMDLCPVTPLGFDGGNVVFAMPEGEIRFAAAAKVGPMLRTDIFACEAGSSFLTLFRNRKDEFMQLAAAMWFVRQCRARGKWDRRRRIRSLGVWPGDNGAVVLHRGDEIWTFADKSIVKLSVGQAMKALKGPLYLLQPSRPEPVDGASAADGARVRAILDHWRFEPVGEDGLTGADVVAGWLMGALLGAVSPFRAHLLIFAMPGSGKTTFLELIKALLGGLIDEIVTSFTDAGLRSDITGMARPYLLDEVESAPGAVGLSPIQQALDVLNIMSTGSGGSRKQADGAGGAITQTAMGSAMLCAVNPPRIPDALATRIAELRLSPLTAPGADGKVAPLAADKSIKAATAWAGELGPKLLWRALKGAERYAADFERLKLAMTEAGEPPRLADLVASLAAGRRLLLTDEPLDAESTADELALWASMLAERREASPVSNPGQDALAHLFAWDAGIHNHGSRLTIGELVRRWLLGEPDRERTLREFGLRPIRNKTDGIPFLLVANKHPALERIFDKTRWPDWTRSLGYLDQLGPDFATFKPNKPIRFSLGVQQRAIAIPLTPWEEKKTASRPRDAVDRTVSVPDQDDDA